MRRLVLNLAFGVLAAVGADAAEFKAVSADQKHDAGVDGITLFHDGRHFATRANDQTGVWNTKTGERVAVLEDSRGNGGTWLSATDNADVPVVIVQSEAVGDGRRVVDVVSGATLAVIAAKEVPHAAVMSSDGLVLVTGVKEAGGYRVRIWDIGGKRVLATALVGPPDQDDTTSSPAILVSREARWVAAFKDGRIDLVDGTTGVVRQVNLPGKSAAEKMTALGFSEDGRRLMVAGSSKSIHSVKAADLTLVTSLELSTDPAKRRFTEIEGGRVIRIDGRRATGFADAVTGKVIWHARGSSVSAYVFKSLGQGLFLRASKTRQGPVTHGVYRHQKGDFKLLWKKETQGLDLSAFAGNGNGKCLILAGSDATQVVDPLTGQTIARITGLSAPITAAIFTPDGARLISGDAQGRIALTPMPTECAVR